ncbi:TetR/AcrR family transcriptional regulator [Kribbella sandramycini]|uniref:AcrR family transcriptional regulator n=1 Tax=Kribbella sandramycini TaxID=60450 RepID=A0A7Y4NXV3_9ACTN|nr:TetR/AcrR family transcriptional regulator [Kribbella sandramycini]MBB6567535.1 AcrR family transcriptional regulator [Kribbella sandramycini]NOL39861.1 TetR/AcrR family transcriptional regulator [Kribbella sandramycini]
MAVLAEQESGSAARILGAARELVLKRGVKGLTVAEIADRAHVAKGTIYLHWSTREDLLVGLFGRDFLAEHDELAELLTADPDVARPSRLLPLLVQATIDHPFIRALQSEDDDLLGVLTQHPRSAKLLENLGPAALLRVALPVWRRHHLARTDWSFDDQAYALQALLLGFLNTAVERRALAIISVDEPAQVISAAVTALLGPEQPGPGDIQATADAALAELAVRRAALLESIAKSD